MEAAARVGEPARQIHQSCRWQHHDAANTARMRCNAGPSTSDSKRSRTPDGSSTSIPHGSALDEATEDGRGCGDDGDGAVVFGTGPGKTAGTSGLISTAQKPATGSLWSGGDASQLHISQPIR